MWSTPLNVFESFVFSLFAIFVKIGFVGFFNKIVLM